MSFYDSRFEAKWRPGLRPMWFKGNSTVDARQTNNCRSI